MRTTYDSISWFQVGSLLVYILPHETK